MHKFIVCAIPGGDKIPNVHNCGVTIQHLRAQVELVLVVDTQDILFIVINLQTNCLI